MTLQEMRQRKADALAKARALHNAAVGENRELTAEEQSTFDKHKADAKRFDAQITEEENLLDQERALASAAVQTR